MNVNEMDTDGMSTLRWACARSHKATIVALLSNPQLNPNAGLPGKNRPVHVALKWVSRSWRGTESIEIPLLVLKDRRTDVHAAGDAYTGLSWLRPRPYSHSPYLKLLSISAYATVVDTQSFRTCYSIIRTLI